MRSGRARLAERLALVAVGLVAAPFVVPFLARPSAAALYAGDHDAVVGLASAVELDVARGARRQSFATGSERFDHEWTFGASMMAAMGLGQAAVLVPRERARFVRSMERALDAMLSDAGRAYDRDAWGEDPLDALAHDRGHMAYLGYGGLALSLHRLLAPRSRLASLHDRFVAAIARRLAMGTIPETYPGERYPPDLAMAYGALCLSARGGHTAPPDLAAFARHGVDPRTSLLYQSLDAEGRVVDGTRGSGTAFAAYALSFCGGDLARGLDAALERHLLTGIGGFGAVREYPRGHAGKGDIDSGPVVLGTSVSATGFSLAGARVFRRRERFVRVFATAWLFGAPTGRDMRRGFVTGGPLGDAILLAMTTALTREELARGAR